MLQDLPEADAALFLIQWFDIVSNRQQINGPDVRLERVNHLETVET